MGIADTHFEDLWEVGGPLAQTPAPGPAPVTGAGLLAQVGAEALLQLLQDTLALAPHFSIGQGLAR